MPLYSADALILRTYKLGEADRIVVFLTRDRGKKRGVAKGARRPEVELRRRARAADARARRVFRERAARAGQPELLGAVALGAVERARSKALGCAAYFAELIDEWAAESHEDERLYRLGVSMVEAIAAGVPSEPLTRYFEYWLLSLQGVYPAGRVPGLSPEAQAFLSAARKVGPQDLAGVAADRAMLRELEALHRSMIAMHLEREPRSIKVLKEMTRL